MMKDLLITIAAHYNPERLKYLKSVVGNFVDNYKVSFDIIINTNTTGLEYFNSENILVVVSEKLDHPFHLTSLHRHHIKHNIDRYKTFMYVEDDELIPFENYLNYLENFKLLWPKCVPLFVRVEESGGVKYISDIVEKQSLKTIKVGGKEFTELCFPNNYHGFWIMPQKELKESIDDSFTNLSIGREFNAMFVGWHLGKKSVIQVENKLISEKCYSYHLPNNYAENEETIQAKITPEKIFL